jgi:hypothetical protein
LLLLWRMCGPLLLQERRLFLFPFARMTSPPSLSFALAQRRRWRQSSDSGSPGVLRLWGCSLSLLLLDVLVPQKKGFYRVLSLMLRPSLTSQLPQKVWGSRRRRKRSGKGKGKGKGRRKSAAPPCN